MSEIEKKLDAGKVYLGFRTYYDRESVDSLLSEVTRLQAELELERAWVKALEIVDTRHGVKLVDRLKQSENRVTELEAERRRDALDGQATMEEAYDRIKELESKKDARIKTLEEGIGKARNLVENIQCSRKVSIGSLDNTYAVQLDVIRVDNLADLLKELDG